MPATAPRAVLVHRRGGLGDTLLMLPVLRCLRRRWPAARVTLAGVAEFGAVLAEHGAADAAVATDTLAVWAAGLDSAAGAAARAALAAFDVVVIDQALPAWPDGPQVLAFDPTRVAVAVPFGLQLARQLGLAPSWPDDAWLLPPRLGTTGTVVLAPGSGGRAKCWPRERWLALAARLGAGPPPAVVVGPTEVERDDPRRWRWPVPVGFVVDRTATGLAAELAAARAFVGNDSGTTHLAAMLGTPTVALFGPTDPSVWAPVGPHVRVLRGAHGDLAGLGVDAVTAALGA
jgi:heptosyltransferase-3